MLIHFLQHLRKRWILKEKLDFVFILIMYKSLRTVFKTCVFLPCILYNRFLSILCKYLWRLKNKGNRDITKIGREEIFDQAVVNILFYSKLVPL